MFLAAANIDVAPQPITTNGQAAMLKHAHNMIKNDHPHCHDLALAYGMDYDQVRWSAQFHRIVANSLRANKVFANVPPV